MPRDSESAWIAVENHSREWCGELRVAWKSHSNREPRRTAGNLVGLEVVGEHRQRFDRGVRRIEHATRFDPGAGGRQGDPLQLPLDGGHFEAWLRAERRRSTCRESPSGPELRASASSDLRSFRPPDATPYRRQPESRSLLPESFFRPFERKVEDSNL